MEVFPGTSTRFSNAIVSNNFELIFIVLIASSSMAKRTKRHVRCPLQASFFSAYFAFLSIFKRKKNLQRKLLISTMYFFAETPVTQLRFLTDVSDNIDVPFASLRSLILLLSSIELRLFDSLLRSSWNARQTSRKINNLKV